MPKRPGESRPTFSAELREDLLRVAHDRGRPETEISPLLEALAREWIEKGTFRRREEELDEIVGRLAAVEKQLRILADARHAGPLSTASSATQESKITPIPDNLTRRILQYLSSIVDDVAVTPPVSGKVIAQGIGRPGDQPTGKQIMARIEKLIKKGRVSIETNSGGKGGRRYRIENPEWIPDVDHE